MKASRNILLASVALIAPLMAIHRAAAADLPILASPESFGGWYVDTSTIEVGGQLFIDKPGTGPDARSDNLAKFNEYGDRSEAGLVPFLDLGIASADGHYDAEFRAKNVGNNDESFELGFEQPGTEYLTLGYDQTPHLYSDTAQTIFNGLGTNNLTVPASVVQQLYAGIANGNMYTSGAGTNSTFTVPKAGGGTAAVPNGCFLPGQANGTITNAPACAAGVTPVATTIANAEHPVTLGLQRDRFEVGERWTPTTDWDVNVDYSNEHRYGLQEQGFLFSNSTSTPMAQVAAPVDDTTQDASISAEYSGYSPWGMRWNGIVKYDASIYTDRYSAFQAENPFGGPGSPVSGVPDCPVASATATPNCYGVGQEGTPPDNQSNSINATVGVDLPWFKQSRYMGTFAYNAMTQNAAFIPMTINSNGGSNQWPTTNTSTFATLAPLSRSSLDGEINTTLFNNVLTSELTSDLKNKLSYRYYSDDNTTPALTLQNFIINDSSIATNTVVDGGSLAPHGTLFSSYTKQDAGDELTWDPIKWANVGASGNWERYDYTDYAVKDTNEYTGKVFADLNPTDWLQVRISDSQSWRRYDDYNWLGYIGNVVQPTLMPISPTASNLFENPLLADVNVANRDRNLANLFVDITTPIQGLTLTPTATVRWDNYPTDPNLIAAANQFVSEYSNFTGPGQYQLGLRSDHDWTAGIEASYSPDAMFTFTASYMYEQERQQLLGDGSSTNLTTVFYNNMSEDINSWTGSADVKLIPDRLDLKLSGTYSKANDSWDIAGEPGCGTSTSCGPSANNPAYPPTSNDFYHVDAVLTYKIDPTLLAQFGSKGEAFLKLHYLWERNSVTNWQDDETEVYMYSLANSNTTGFKDQIFMAGDNPNYNAQALVASLIVKW